MNTTIITKKNVRNYIEKFLDGETSNAEEQALYDFFKNEDVPQSLQEYAPMFAWYDGKMEEDTRRLIEENRRQSRIIRIRLVRWSIAAAAMVAVMVSVGIALFTDSTSSTSIYDGSYVKVGNTVNSNINEIMPEIEATIAHADDVERKALETYRNLQQAENEIEQKGRQ